MAILVAESVPYRLSLSRHTSTERDLLCLFCTQIVLRESSSEESSDTETRNAANAASAAVSNDKRPRVTANSLKNGQAFDGNSAAC